MGAWIEISYALHKNNSYIVAPLVGAWIEMVKYTEFKDGILSLLSWERGLKLSDNI